MTAASIALDDLAATLALGPHEMVSLVGGGGKTTTLFALGRQLAGTVVLTTTTKMGRDRTDGRTVLFDPSDHELGAALAQHRVVLVWRATDEHKAHGVDAASCDRWFDAADHVVVEADGSRQHPLTAPGPFEPVVPPRSTKVVACVGSAALGRVIADACHRPLRVAAAADCSPADRLTPDRLARLLRSDRGLRKGVPPESSYTVVVANVTDADRPFVDGLAAALDGETEVIAVAAQGPVSRVEGAARGGPSARTPGDRSV